MNKILKLTEPENFLPLLQTANGFEDYDTENNAKTNFTVDKDKYIVEACNQYPELQKRFIRSLELISKLIAYSEKVPTELKDAGRDFIKENS